MGEADGPDAQGGGEVPSIAQTVKGKQRVSRWQWQHSGLALIPLPSQRLLRLHDQAAVPGAWKTSTGGLAACLSRSYLVLNAFTEKSASTIRPFSRAVFR